MIRWISGVIFAILVVFLLLYVSKIGIQLTVVVLSMWGLKEYFELTLKEVSLVVRLIGVFIGGIATSLLIFVIHTPDQFLSLFAGILIVTFLVHFRGNPNFTERIQKMAFFYFGIMYTSLLFSYWGWILNLEPWKFWVFLMLGSTFLADVGGYVFGHLFGKNRLAPHLSPGKTIEGAIGGFVFSVSGAFIVRALFWPDFPIGKLVLICTLISTFGPLGDLSESLIKRGVHAKDSGNLIPGHGGLLDRVDALLFTGPVVYYCAKFLL